MLENHQTTLNIFSFVFELFASILLSFFILRIMALLGKRAFKILACALVVISVFVSYYMFFFNATIGYGVIAATLTTDMDLSKEMIGFNLFLWVILLSIIPLMAIYQSTLTPTLIQQIKDKQWRPFGILLLVIVLVWAPLKAIDSKRDQLEIKATTDLPSYGGIVSHSYLPANWLTATGLFAYTKFEEAQDNTELFDPAKQYRYIAPQGVDDTYIIFILGETTRWDHMGLLGYTRNTTPKLSQEKNLLAFAGKSCDTSTKLSMRCMFVREGGADKNPQRTLKEKNIFAVLKSLGFSSELYAMQSETWFYNSIEADDYAFREMIAAEKENEGKPIQDMLLLPKVKNSIARHPNGKHLLVLHTKGSHYLYSMRYPREYAQFKPECMGSNTTCSKTQLVNAFDNSILYTDSFISQVLDQVRDKKAIVFYASDHGESIEENAHLHGTPKELAPADQFKSAMLVWASNAYLADPSNKTLFETLKQHAQTKAVIPHEAIFDTMLGCLGYQSPNGGIKQQNNWCQKPIAPTI